MTSASLRSNIQGKMLIQLGLHTKNTESTKQIICTTLLPEVSFMAQPYRGWCLTKKHNIQLNYFSAKQGKTYSPTFKNLKISFLVYYKLCEQQE